MRLRGLRLVHTHLKSEPLTQDDLTDLALLCSVPGISLLNGLAVALPFRPAEKQALLEAASPMEREEMLLALMGMGIERVSKEEFDAPPIVN